MFKWRTSVPAAPKEGCAVLLLRRETEGLLQVVLLLLLLLTLVSYLF